MNILCLEQGDWVKSDSYPGMGTDWELPQLGDFALSPNARSDLLRYEMIRRAG
jgi:hypothetical protein